MFLWRKFLLPKGLGSEFAHWDVRPRDLVAFWQHHSGTALRLGERRGWRAAGPGPQIIRLLFDQPQRLKRIWLVFEETEIQRTQEFALRWSPDRGNSFREIVRQQWNFSSPVTVRETEDYTVDLSDVTVLELKIIPDKSGGEARASVASFRLAW
jgi:hypothetical protein